MATHLFLASTPFNMLTAAIVAFDLPEQDQAILGLIDQPPQQRPFVDALMAWQESPFTSIQLLSNQAKGKQKRRIRQQAFSNIDQLLQSVSPDQIYTGNDRRIEFQYAMHKSDSSMGVYLDDGTYSYLGGKNHWLKDRLIDNLVKKLAYGLWWKQPPTIGGSDWIQQAIVAFPDAVTEGLTKKQLSSLPHNLERPEFRQLAKLATANSGITEAQLQHIDALLLLPHESVVSQQTQKKLITWLTENNGTTAFKHHPRSQLPEGGDSSTWGLPDDAIQVPGGLPMEMLLPLLGKHCHLAGDVSTALLTAKWLRPELDVTAFCADTTTQSWIELLQRLAIRVISPDSNRTTT